MPIYSKNGLFYCLYDSAEVEIPAYFVEQYGGIESAKVKLANIIRKKRFELNIPVLMKDGRLVFAIKTKCHYCGNKVSVNHAKCICGTEV